MFTEVFRSFERIERFSTYKYVVEDLPVKLIQRCIAAEFRRPGVIFPENPCSDQAVFQQSLNRVFPCDNIETGAGFQQAARQPQPYRPAAIY